jgi:SOS response regulatory protein OraA/RecX
MKTPSESLFASDGVRAGDVVISDVKPLGADARRWAVMAGRRRLAAVCDSTVEALGLRSGVTWTEELAASVRRADQIARVRSLVAKRLVKNQKSTAEARELLVSKGLTVEEASGAVAHLSRLGLLDDRVLAESVVQSGTSRGPVARQVLEERLAKRRMDADAARSALESVLSGRSEADDALAIAEERLGSLRNEPDSTVARRLLAYLARRGYEGETARAAVESAMRRAGRLEFPNL